MHYLIGHLIGDYILQTDWIANNKTWKQRKWFGLFVAWLHAVGIIIAIFFCAALATKTWTFWAPWKLVVIFLSHAIQDWTRAPRLWMDFCGQFIYFRDNLPEAYLWSVFVVDNVWHLVLLFVLANI